MKPDRAKEILVETCHKYEGAMLSGSMAWMVEAMNIYADERLAEVAPKQEKKRHRTYFQNRYYWNLIEIISDFTGFQKEDLHSLLKSMFLKKDLVTEDGKIFETIGSTADLTTEQFAHYIEKIKVWANTDLELTLPEPKQQLRFTKQ